MSSKKAAKKLKKKHKKRMEELTPIALFDAARGGDCGAIQRLIDGGMDVNALVESRATHPDTGQPVRTTALYHALAHNQQAAVRLLLERGADPNLGDSTGLTPLRWPQSGTPCRGCGC